MKCVNVDTDVKYVSHREKTMSKISTIMKHILAGVPNKKRRGTNNDKTNVTNEITNTRTKKNCNRKIA